MSDDVIVTDRLVVRFRGKAALDGFSLAVPRGAVMALLGENGAGKSTSMKVLTGQLQSDGMHPSLKGAHLYAKTIRQAFADLSARHTGKQVTLKELPLP